MSACLFANLSFFYLFVRFLFFRNGGFESKNDPVSKIVANKRYYDAKLRFFYTYSLRTETRESEAGDDWYLKGYNEEL